MLAELETDEDFQKMSDNEQVNKPVQSCNKNPKTQKKTRQPYNFLLTQWNLFFIHFHSKHQNGYLYFQIQYDNTPGWSFTIQSHRLYFNDNELS